jgi:UDP-2,4-diacetamido-2,4,6-trideoxy-beta-L-altropyranose hydrolase
MKNIGFIFDSSHKIGRGHFWRCFNLAKLLKNKNRNFFFFSNKLEKSFIDILKKEKFYYLKISSLKKMHVIKNLIKDKKLDTFISDYYDLKFKNKKEIKNLVDSFIVIDDHINKRHCCDVYINNNFLTNASKKKIKKLNPNTKLLLGTKYFIHNQKFLKIINKQKNKKKIKNIFAFFGSSDSSSETLKFIKSIIGFDNLKFQILIGNLNKDFKIIKNYCKDKKNIRLFYNLSNYKTLKLMQNNDLSFGSGGINLTERLFVGLPSVAICTALNQKDALIALKEKKIIHYLGESKEINDVKIKNCIKNLIENKNILSSLQKKTNKHYNKKMNSNLLSKELNLI